MTGFTSPRLSGYAALAHRLMVRPELGVQRLRGEDVVEEALQTGPTPPAEDALRRAEA